MEAGSSRETLIQPGKHETIYDHGEREKRKSFSQTRMEWSDRMVTG